VNWAGGRLTNVRRGFLKACSRAGLTDLHFHDLHTFASQFVMAGGDLYILQEILGHKSITNDPEVCPPLPRL
jgi:site-specific recombinase XerD